MPLSASAIPAIHPRWARRIRIHVLRAGILFNLISGLHGNKACRTRYPRVSVFTPAATSVAMAGDDRRILATTSRRKRA
jgi:hypothetical protein